MSSTFRVLFSGLFFELKVLKEFFQVLFRPDLVAMRFHRGADVLRQREKIAFSRNKPGRRVRSVSEKRIIPQVQKITPAFILSRRAENMTGSGGKIRTEEFIVENADRKIRQLLIDQNGNFDFAR